jgi:hypothetical protein
MSFDRVCVGGPQIETADLSLDTPPETLAGSTEVS